MYKLITVQEAANLIQDGETVAFNGQARNSVPEMFYPALAERFERTGTPKNLCYLATSNFPAANVLSGHKGLIKEMIVAHWQVAITAFSKEIEDNEMEAYSLPQGYLALNYDAAAAKSPGFLSRIGLHTSADPRYGSCGINEISTKQFATPTIVDGKEYLFYRTITPNVCVLRGTTADPEGNITMEHEATITDPLSMAFAAHNNGGKVIVQVERFSPSPADPHCVKIPGCLVDYIYHDPNQQAMDDCAYNPIYTGEKRLVGEEFENFLAELYDINSRKRAPADVFIAKRAAMELEPNHIVNLGIGIPILVPFVAKQLGRLDHSITFSIECGPLGGIPSGCYFGMNVNVSAILSQANVFRFYEGRGLDLTCVGALEIDRHGNVNVLRKGSKIFGLGGFNYVTAGAKKLLVLSRFMVGSNLENVNGILRYQDGRANKFCEDVEHINFAADIALQDEQEVLYITERCVFRLMANGLELIEIAPGLDLEKDVISKLPFRPAISPELKEMPWECFTM